MTIFASKLGRARLIMLRCTGTNDLASSFSTVYDLFKEIRQNTVFQLALETYVFSPGVAIARACKGNLIQIDGLRISI